MFAQLASDLQQLPLWQQIVIFGGASLALYLVLLAIGRVLKRKAQLPLGFFYQTAAFAASLYIAANFFLPTLPFRRDLGAVAILAGVGALLPLLTHHLMPWLFEKRTHIPMPRFLREVIGLVIVIATALAVLQLDYDIQIPGLIAGSGIVALAIGLAAQDLLGNIIGGFTLHFGRPFQVNDWLLLDGQHVQVIEINRRSTRFRTNDNIQLDVPNAHIIKQTITNYYGQDRKFGDRTRPHGMRLEVGLDYGVPPNRIKEVLAAAAAAVPNVLPKPTPDVYLKSFGDSSVNYEIRYWIEDHAEHQRIADAIRTNVWYMLRRAGIKIPFPIRTLQMERRSQQSTLRHGRKHDALRAMLEKQAIFSAISTEDLDYLLEQCASHHFGRGESIIEEKAAGESMFVITSGRAAVIISGDSGTRSQVAELLAGDCFGEMSLLTGEPRSATVQALSDCEVLEITKPVFGEIVDREQDLLPRLSELLAQRKLETEGFTSRNRESAGEVVAAKQREYKARFLSRISSFFEL